VSGRLRTRSAVITGAGRGIGAAIARLFAAEGAALCLNDRDAEPLLTLARELSDSGAEVVTVVADLTDPSTAGRLVEACVATYGRLDVLVNNAAIIARTPVADLDLAEWQAILAVDLTATFLCSQAAIGPMTAQGGGRIINVSSQLAQRGAAGFAAYCAAKAGVLGFTKAVAREVASRGITVNAVAPGPIETDMLTQDGNTWSPDDVQALPLGRIGSAEEVAPTVLFLASEPDGNLFTGQTLGPNSGDVMP
jgi:3-oxoacyl-[acyl-carrier protein] reductase